MPSSMPFESQSQSQSPNNPRSSASTQRNIEPAPPRDNDRRRLSQHELSSRPFKVARSLNQGYREASVFHGRSTNTIEAASSIGSPVTTLVPGASYVQEPVVPQTTGSENQRIRPRGPTACRTCRLRKTKCDSQRPSCSYCLRFNATCSYVEDEVLPRSCHLFGPQILSAVNNLRDLVQQRLEHPIIISPSGNNNNTNSNNIPSIDAVNLANSPISNDTHEHNWRSPFGGRQSVHSDDTQTTQNVIKLDRGGFAPQGLDDIINWNVFGNSETPWDPLPGLFHEDRTYSVPNYQLPVINMSTMTKLRARYIAGLHFKNPFLNLQDLDKQIANVVELGFDWSINTCLVALVCSIGALVDAPPEPDSRDNSVRVDSASDLDLAMQFWNIAIRRLGFAIGENSLEAAQCLCLAGIWYMNMLQPLQAWKYFNLAGNARFLMILRRDDDRTHNLQQTLTLEQILYFTILKFEFELRAELALPASVLSEIDPVYDFPLAPQIELSAAENIIFDTERTWHYYLAEIASRHLTNCLLQSQSSYEIKPNNLQRMFSDLDMFNTQLEQWYISLPATISFELPDGAFVPPVTDDLRLIMRGRYFMMRELMYRPFVKLCVEHTFTGVGVDSVEKITSLASHCLQDAIYRLQTATFFQHQSLWYALRNLVGCSMLLIAAHNAQARPDRYAAQRLRLPRNWRHEIDGALARAGVYTEEPAGGTAEIFAILRGRLGELS